MLLQRKILLYHVRCKGAIRHASPVGAGWPQQHQDYCTAPIVTRKNARRSKPVGHSLRAHASRLIDKNFNSFWALGSKLSWMDGHHIARVLIILCHSQVIVDFPSQRSTLQQQCGTIISRRMVDENLELCQRPLQSTVDSGPAAI